MKNKKVSIAIASCLCIMILLALSSAVKPEPLTDRDQANKEYEQLLEEFGLSAKMDKLGVPGVSLAVIKGGKLEWAKGYGLLQAGTDEEINTETLFSVGSLSKVGTALMCLKLQDDGLLKVDTDVNQYLQSWKVPDNEYTQKQAVTLRRIMSHTAGLTVHGFADFKPEEDLPTTVQILKGEKPAKNRAVYVDIPVGSQFRYSGGGTTIEQMIIEDLRDQAFHEAAKELLFEPLDMSRSSYENPLPTEVGNIAKAHNRRGKPIAQPRGYQSMPEAAASGLWTTPSDYAKLIIMLMKAYEGDDFYLSQETVQDMMTPVDPSEYGLGPRIKASTDDVQFSHGGSNDSYKAHFIGTLGAQNGIVIFTNGAQGTTLIREILPVFDPVLF